MESVARYIESAKLHVLEHPLQAAAASVALLGATHYLFGSPRSLTVNPQECIIVITGCDTGFGLMSCHRLSKLGYLVVAACLQAQSVEALSGVVALPIQCDVTKEADIRNLVQKTEELARSRNARVWTLVNNAGIAKGGCIDWIPSAACRQVMEVNFFALFEVTRAFLPLLKKVKDSRIINICSAAGFTGSYQAGVYCGKRERVLVVRCT
jgi:NAD(P)-dependent dehydrogenase (short-subunit alcohol dehydrogenase family)